MFVVDMMYLPNFQREEQIPSPSAKNIEGQNNFPVPINLPLVKVNGAASAFKTARNHAASTRLLWIASAISKSTR